MTSEVDQPVCCSHCGEGMTAPQVLDDAGRSWPQHFWIVYQCRHCGLLNIVRLADGEVTAGKLDGVPGPAFVPRRTTGVKGMKVTGDKNGICIRVGELSWDVPAR